jgi:calcineurin-like phosphoesterase family protein
MEIRNKEVQDIIMSLFESQGVDKVPGGIITGFLKKRGKQNKDDYVKLFYNEHTITLSKFITKEYQAIKSHIEGEIKHKPEATLKSLSLEQLENLPKEIKDEMKHIWFSADFHQGHRPIAESLWDGINRPTNMETHDDWLINIINAKVGKKDKFYILGDLSLAPKKEAEKFIMKLNGDKVLIIGNHDKNIKNTNLISEKTHIKEFKFKREGIEIFAVLCHYPMVSWNRSFHGAWQLYGHVHGRYNNIEKLAMDVGLDNEELNHEPINLYDIAVKMVERKEIINNMIRC